MIPCILFCPTVYECAQNMIHFRFIGTKTVLFMKRKEKKKHFKNHTILFKIEGIT
jgi:hypothetical protein